MLPRRILHSFKNKAFAMRPISQGGRKIWQPLHPAVRDKLDPEYVSFHDQFVQYVQPDETKPWDGTARTHPSLPPGGLPPVDVGSIRDFDTGRFWVRAYTPEGEPDEGGWPVLIWYRGGGWVLGGLNDSKDFCSWVCREAQCVVVTVGYRAAPEHPFPAAVEDAIDAVRWLFSAPFELGKIDTTRVAIGGTSAGAGLAITAAISALDTHISFPAAKPSYPTTTIHPAVALVLIVPVIDNTATFDGIWKANGETSPFLTASRMEWFRKLYFTKDEQRSSWDASPNLSPDALLQRLPKTYLVYAEQDLLAPEAMALGRQLKDLGVEVETDVVEGGVHSILVLGGRVARGKKLIEDTARYLKGVFES